MQPCPNAYRRIIVANAEYAAIGLGPGPGAPAGDERTRERRIEKMDRHSVIQHATHPRWGYRPAVSATILIEPCCDVGVSLAEPAGRHTEPDADGKTPLGHSNHLSGMTRHFEVPSL